MLALSVADTATGNQSAETVGEAASEEAEEVATDHQEETLAAQNLGLASTVDKQDTCT